MKRAVVLFHYRFLNGILRLFSRLLYKSISEKAGKVLVVRKGNLGDMVCSIPSFHAIRFFFNQSELHLLTTQGNLSSISFSMFHHELFFKKTIHYNAYTTHELRAVLAKEKYDAVVELPADVDTFYTQIRNMIFFRMLGIKCGGGWCVSNTLFLKKWQLKELVFEREQERLKKILQQIGIRTHQEDYHSLYNASDLDFVKSSFLKAKNINSDKIIAIATGAKLERKKWPMERFKEVTFHLLEVGYQVFLIGDAKDAEETATWQHQLLVNLQGKLTIPQTAALLSHCKLLLCNDSGPMHLAYAAGAKVLALFSARNYRDKWYPPDGNKILVNYNVDCAICRKQMCSNNICMQLIEVSEVKKELDVLLSQV